MTTPTGYVIRNAQDAYKLYTYLRWYQTRHKGNLVLDQEQIAFVAWIEPLLRLFPTDYGIPFFYDVSGEALWFDKRFVEKLANLPEFCLTIGYGKDSVHRVDSSS